MEFYHGGRWVPVTKCTGEFFASKFLRDRFGGVGTLKNFLDVDKTPALERPFKGAAKLSRGLPTDLEMESISLEELSSLAEDIHVKTRETS